MSESPLLFPYLDVAMRVIALLILCALPVLLMPAGPQIKSPRRVARPKSALTTID